MQTFLTMSGVGIFCFFVMAGLALMIWAAQDYD